MTGHDASSLRRLPSVNAVLETAEASTLMERFGRSASTDAIREVIGKAREAIGTALVPAPDAQALALEALALLDERRPGLRALFNLTGTVLHTNFGRAVLAEAAIEAAVEAMRSAVALEYDLATGARGDRDDHVRVLLRDPTGAEDATVVNNNAAAVLLGINTFAHGREAVVSRGELIEIG